MVGDYICTAKMLPDVYCMIKHNTTGCLKFAMESAIEPEEIELEGLQFFSSNFEISNFLIRKIFK